MSGRQYRKPKKRPSREREDQLAETKREADLDELWTVLAGQREETSWHIPWRRGIVAGRLALDLVRQLSVIEAKLIRHGGEGDARMKLAAFDAAHRFAAPLEEKHHSSHDYWMLQDHLDAMYRASFTARDRYLIKALRIFQLCLAQSDGGGIAYNTILVEGWDLLPDAIDRNRLLRRYRCEDALGISPEFTQQPDLDRCRRAFYTAWDRGLYSVAYAVGRAL